MHTISRRNVNENYPDGLWHLKIEGTVEESRNGQVIVAPGPVVNVYHNPRERVLFDSIRDANPYFHFFEALWMLAGRRDVEYVAQFVKRMRDYSDDGVTLGGAYGHRWRHEFEYDQLNWIVEHLQDQPGSRRAVLQMYDTKWDCQGGKDVPCNTHIYISIRNNKLDIMVCCRSNDAIWGCYGANMVHFSFLQEYLACGLGIEVGKYTQVSNNFHVYPDIPNFEAMWAAPSSEDNNLYELTTEIKPGPLLYDLQQNHKDFYHTLKDWLEIPNKETCYSFLNGVAYPMWRSFQTHKLSRACKTAFHYAEEIDAPDWRYACTSWLTRRVKK